MKAAVYETHGDPNEVVEVKEVGQPSELKPDEMLVKVASAAVNPLDWKIIVGAIKVPSKQKIPGLDYSGTVVSVGSDVKDYKEGDSVFGCSRGTFAEYVVVSSKACAKKPEGLSHHEAAALPLAGLTAMQGLLTHGQRRGVTGGKIAIFGGSGGVGSLAIQIAKRVLNAEHVYATGSAVEQILGHGADTVINYKTTNVGDALKGKNLDVVFDCVGGADAWQAARQGLKPGGIFVTIAGDSQESFGNVVSTMIKGYWRRLLGKTGLGQKYVFFLVDPLMEGNMAQLAEWVAEKAVHPVVEEKVYSLTTASVRALFEASMSHRSKGKLVLDVD
ncbi:NAD(P)-dependent alcohol dehydrogenase [Marinobacter sp. F4218]|uniref:NAD(P)-dependent alcohol dehydrogenase n=1 Tax=Marinobacter sp. F4218 TaxID=2862868 RepID=UPI001C627656|nr:NAD(P)-dependent alcohol dehydrogenase [Marinobacter sp. F4218]MBW7469842.1 NAD(P)-dependent alcohol dehydrogenase [Marinobacter sp. F4218]